MKIDLDKWEQSAKAAQDYAPGDWMIDKMTSEEAYLAGNKDADDYEGYSVFASNHDRIIHDGEIHHDVVQHIAAFSPDVVLAMIARIRELERDLDDKRAEVRTLFERLAGR